MFKKIQTASGCTFENKSPAILKVLLADIHVTSFLYSGIIPAKKTYFYAGIIPKENVTVLKGKVVSNPVKNASTGSYTCDFRTEYAKSKTKGINAECRGTVRLVLPPAFVEAFFPGKLYSQSAAGSPSGSGAVLCDTGAVLEVTGAFFRNGGEETFLAKNVRQLPWNTTLFGKISRFRALFRLKFRRIMFYWNEAGGLFLALISGIREYTDQSAADSFRRAGLSHILALSGMHLSLFSGITAKISHKTGKKAEFIFQFAAIVLFVWFAGLSPSLFRALLCSSITLFCSMLRIKSLKPLDILSASFLIHCVIFPADAFKTAFLLSYGALLGILLFSEFFTRILIRTVPPSCASAIGASTGAQSLTAPVSIKCFGTFAPVGIISTAVISPLITFFIFSGLFSLIISFAFPFFAPAAAFFMNLVYTVIIKSVRLFACAPAFSF